MSAATTTVVEFAMTDADFSAIARMTHTHSGIVLNDGKRQLVYARLAKQVRHHGMSGFGPYVALLRTDADARREAIFALTTNHTKFFREAHHFDHFADAVRPGLVSQAERGKPVRLWSSASSSGEEPYSLAMTLLGDDRFSGARLAQRDVAILATDLAPHVLDIATAGRYPAEVAKAIPTALRRAWTQTHDEKIAMAPDLMRIVNCRLLNLLEPWPMRGGFDAIFCRNVMIYFDEPTKQRLTERFAQLLAPGKFLYIGHSERITGPAAALFEPAGNTIYRRLA